MSSICPERLSNRHKAKLAGAAALAAGSTGGSLATAAGLGQVLSLALQEAGQAAAAVASSGLPRLQDQKN